ncbi:bifunctional DNA primase/polymerase, partial [Mycolicibacterium sphagni]|uniref:bifunctional DNA primase/polymerase n=1 Tax=Mycolicibacterium sphagni TaxID=1786 RepID=UPI0021F2C89D
MPRGKRHHVMPDDDTTPPGDKVVGYGDAADLYWSGGWRGVLPLRRRTKKSPPGGRTGYEGEDPSYPDLMQYIELYPDGNLCLRLPEGIIGIDVDAYSTKTGGKTLAEAERRWGPLPATILSTSRLADPVSGIRYFRVPADIPFEDRISFPELQLGDIEIIKRVHRYSIVWPSVHPDSGDTYWWLNHDRQIIGVPAVDDITTDLPQTWIDGIKAKPGPDLGSLDGNVDVNMCLTTGDPSPRVAAKLGEAIRDCNVGDATSRHDTIRDHVLTLLRFGKDGDTGVYNALLALRALFVAAVTRDGSRTIEEANREFARFLTNKRTSQLLGIPSHNDWVRNIDFDAQAIAAEVAAETPQDTNIPAAPPPAAPTAPTPPPATQPAPASPPPAVPAPPTPDT